MVQNGKGTIDGRMITGKWKLLHGKGMICNQKICEKNGEESGLVQ